MKFRVRKRLFLSVSRQPILRRLFSRSLLLDVDVGLLEHGLFHAQDKGFGLFATQTGGDEVPLIGCGLIAFRQTDGIVIELGHSQL